MGRFRVHETSAPAARAAAGSSAVGRVMAASPARYRAWPRRDYSSLMAAPLATLARFAISTWMNAPNCAAVPPSGSMPATASYWRTSGGLSVSLNTVLSRSTAPLGIPARARTLPKVSNIIDVCPLIGSRCAARRERALARIGRSPPNHSVSVQRPQIIRVK